MKRLSVAIMLAAFLGASSGCCCTQNYLSCLHDKLNWWCHCECNPCGCDPCGDCGRGGDYAGGCDSCCDRHGCGDAYWGDAISVPGGCDACDHHGHWIGSAAPRNGHWVDSPQEPGIVRGKPTPVVKYKTRVVQRDSRFVPRIVHIANSDSRVVQSHPRLIKPTNKKNR